MGYTDSLTGSAVAPSDLSYVQLSLSANVVFGWPGRALATEQTVSRVTEVSALSAGLTATLPDAREVSAGQDVLLLNSGANSFEVLDSTGGSVTEVLPGSARYLVLRDASTAAGDWAVVGFGASSSFVDAASIAGAGMRVSGAKLSPSAELIPISGDYDVSSAAHAKVIVLTGGSATITFPLTTTLGAEFFCGVKNAGDGTMTLAASGAELLDSTATLDFAPGESAYVLSNSADRFYIVGRGRSTTFDFTQLVKAVSVGTVTLSSAESANKLLQFTGVLAGNVAVVVPSVVGIYHVWNNTTGAFTLTVKTSGGVGVQVEQGTRVIVWVDGNDVYNAMTALPSTPILLIDGTLASPSLTFQSDTDTGMYRPGPNLIGVSAGGAEAIRFGETENLVSKPLAFSTVGVRDSSRDALGAASTGRAIAYAIAFG